jgi:sulfite exporter TauE/SafE
MENSVWILLQMGLAAGMLHSLDADHVAAVAGLSSGRSSGTRRICDRWYWSPFSLHWAAGHGAAVMLVALGVFLLGMAIPYQMSALAEQAVAYTLIAIGLAAWFQLYGEFRGRYKPEVPSKKAAVVGLLHGCAGSAPLLALLPATAMTSPTWGLVYVFLFCLGVVFAMLLLGQVLAWSVGSMQRYQNRVLYVVRPLLASFTLLLGCYLAVTF